MSESVPQVSNQEGTKKQASIKARLMTAWAVEFSHLHWRFLLCTLLARFLPEGRVATLRTSLIRAIGLRIGPGTRFFGMPKIQSSPLGLFGPIGPKLRIGAQCEIGVRVILEFGELLTIGDRTSLADGVVILTTTHLLGPMAHRAGPLVRSPVVIGNDVAIGADAIILPGVTIGDAARVLPNAVVNTSVAPGATVSGIPARSLPPSVGSTALT
jgi:acetyltransferase-like isoleucine patch superfamily enzyme